MNILTQSEYNQISDIIKGYHLRYLLGVIGLDYLSDTEKNLLTKLFGKDVLQISTIPLLDQVYLMGKLASTIGDLNINKLEYGDFISYIKKNQFENEKINNERLDKYKKQTYLDVLSAQVKIQNDIRQNILIEENRLTDTNQKVSGKSVENISKRIITDVENWNEGIEKSVTYNFQSAFEQGKADKLEEELGNDTLVYKTPLPGACKYCNELYLTNGYGSEPIIFKLSTLVRNGSNIGRKPYDWLPVVGATHVRCRCPLHKLPENTEWNAKQKRFIPKKVEENNIERKSKVKVFIGSRVFEV